MALVALLKGVNVGGHRTFRPSVLAKELTGLDVVNIGAAGTFVVRNPVNQEDLRSEIVRRLPFETNVIICKGSELLRLVADDPFAGHASDPEMVRFVSVMAKRQRVPSLLPLDLPNEREWGLRVLACQGLFVVGLHRREMRAIRHLSQLEKLLGVPLTTRNWNTVLTITRILGR